jgi:hypothetical protein
LLLFLRLFIFALGVFWVWLGFRGLGLLQRGVVEGWGPSRSTARFWLMRAIWSAGIVTGAAITVFGVIAKA